MNRFGKWLVIGGSALVILGFFLPVVSVTSLFSFSLSLSGVASIGQQAMLYIIPIGALVALILAFLPANSHTQMWLIPIGEAVGLGLGLLVLLLTFVQYSNWITKFGILSDLINALLSAGLGVFVLILGYGLAGVGILLRFFSFTGQLLQRPSAPVAPQQTPEYTQQTGARLEVVRGNLPHSIIPLADNYTIGRSRENHLQLSDMRVSRLHARIRYAQGAWFIQDQNSSAGILVNGQRTLATRLNSGDRITIGDTVFIFYS